MSFVQRAGMVGSPDNFGFTTGTLPSRDACGRRKLKYAANKVTKETDP
ncbi:hypothetical protein HV406_13095 [Bacillus sporothermodurans]|nr:hypothetical protein [Heyndrickxia sporothermodurans]MBL5881205.1 hypothetical protein [Heyndrickxia sporothermodurans]